ncbi:unnamed protein product [Linum trigynum]|uniref:SWIM-type domain-containing protein n=1 Tax=Linum trigynum TaxID=586398 RepID=A0AAV2DEG0_9ROSI
MDEFEEESEDETDEEIAPQVQIDGELQGEGDARTEQAAENVEAPHAQEERRETSQHSSYRLSEDSDHFTPRLKYDSVDQFKNVVVLHSVAAGACLRWKRSEKDRKEVICKDQRCKWKVYASWFRRNHIFMVRKVGQLHSCNRNLRVNQVTAKWIASDMLDRFRINPEWSPDQIMAEIKLKHNMEVKKRTCYRTKVEAVKILSGSLVDEYHVYACNEVDWKKATAELEEIEGNDPLSTPFKDLMDQEPRYFCRSFLSHLPKCDSVESNICETWNGMIVKYRGMRMIDMLEGIRKKVEKEKELARLCTSKQTLDLKCEVKMGNSGYIVDLQTKTCTCGYWSLSGLPCCHVVSAITHLRKDVDDYVHVSYHVNHVREGYKAGIPCLDGRQAWPEATGYPVFPPKQRAQPGRPKKNRRKAAHELEVRPQAHGIGEEVSRRGTVIHCSKCGAQGHNARTCKEPVSNGAPERQGNIITARRTRGSIAQPTPQPTALPTAHNTGKRPRVGHCSKCGSATHNARTCPINQGSGIQHVRLNVGDRRTIAREMRVATAGIGVYVNETTGNTYVRLNGANGRPVGGIQPTVVDVQGSQTPVTQP